MYIEIMETVLWCVYGKRVEDIVTLTHFPYWCGWIDVVNEEVDEEVGGEGGGERRERDNKSRVVFFSRV